MTASPLIFEIRKSYLMSRKEFAELIGVSVMYISLLERGQREPSIDLLNKIEDIFDVQFNISYKRKGL